MEITKHFSLRYNVLTFQILSAECMFTGSLLSKIRLTVPYIPYIRLCQPILTLLAPPIFIFVPEPTAFLLVTHHGSRKYFTSIAFPFLRFAFISFDAISV